MSAREMLAVYYASLPRLVADINNPNSARILAFVVGKIINIQNTMIDL